MSQIINAKYFITWPFLLLTDLRSSLQMSFTKDENGCWNNILCFTIVLVRINLKENICKIFSKISKSFWMKNDHCVKVLLSHCTHVFDPWWSLVLFLMNICPIRTGTWYEQICITPIVRIYYCYPEIVSRLRLSCSMKS